jgi:beta-ribofuranosylaminobenzene 5'-phosphate synthase
MGLELLDDSFALVCLLIKNNGGQANAFKKSCNCFARRFLMAMGFASLRTFGGIGFSIERPVTVFQFEQCSGVEIHGLEVLDAEGKADLGQVIERMTNDRGELHLRAVLKAAPPQHVGFGSKTALSLALIAGVNAFKSIGWPVEHMQKLSGRGAASGVGIHSFFTGGIIWDIGHRADAAKQLLPSGSTTETGIPPLGVRIPFPDAWRVVLVLPAERPMTGQEEINFFVENAPVPKVEALSTMAALYHGVLPAILLRDYSALASALAEVHRFGFKARELGRWSPQLQMALAALSKGEFAAGLSSVGPLIYVILPGDDPAASDTVRAICAGLTTRMLTVVRGWNSGYELRERNWP